jgi:LacI family xylobiose transport system transcriptional regulator
MTRNPGADRVTLARIADDAGVSLSTISKVLNGRPDVSASTRTRVEAMLDEHGYLRRGSGKASPTRLIELVFHELEAAWSMEIIRGVEDVAAEHGLSVVLTQSGDRHSPGAEWVEGVLRRRPGTTTVPKPGSVPSSGSRTSSFAGSKASSRWSSRTAKQTPRDGSISIASTSNGGVAHAWT